MFLMPKFSYGVSSTDSRELYVWNRSLSNVEAICYTTLSFPDNIVSSNNLTKMHIKYLGNERVYQIEDTAFYESGYVKYVGIWLNTSIISTGLTIFPITFETNPPNFTNQTMIINDGANKFLNISTGQLSSSISYEKGLGWVSLITKGTQRLTSINEPSNNSVWNAITENNSEIVTISYTGIVNEWNDALNRLYPSDSTHKSASGETFKLIDGDHNLTRVVFKLSKVGSPIGNDSKVCLYATTGTLGTDSKPTGNALATSNLFDISTLTGSLTEINFTFNGYHLLNNTVYAITFMCPTSGFMDDDNRVVFYKGDNEVYDGNYFCYKNGWVTSGYEGADIYFKLYDSTFRNIAYDYEISNACNISNIQIGALFNKVYWNVTDNYGDLHEGWLRVFKNEAWLEFWTNHTYPVNSTYPDARSIYNFGSDTLTDGTLIQNSSLTCVFDGQADGAGRVGWVKMLFSRPTNFWGFTDTSLEQDNIYGILNTPIIRYSYDFDRLNDTQPLLNQTKLGFGVCLTCVDSYNDNMMEAITEYLKRPIITYYCQSEEDLIKSLLYNAIYKLIANYSYPYSNMVYVLGESETLKVIALRILLGVGNTSEIDTFIAHLNNITETSEEWNDGTGDVFWYPSALTTAYYVWKYCFLHGFNSQKTQIGTQITRILDEIHYFHENIRSLNTKSGMLNVDSYMYSGICLCKDFISYGDAFLNELNAFKYCRIDRGDEITNYIKYDGLIVYYESADMCELSTLFYQPYLFEAYTKYPTTTEPDYLFSLAYQQNSVFWRLHGERDDFQWEFSHYPQDRLCKTWSIFGNLANYVKLDQENTQVKGTASITLLYSHIHDIQNSSGFIPFGLGFNDAEWYHDEWVVTPCHASPSLFEITTILFDEYNPITPVTTTPSGHGSTHSNTDMSEITRTLLELGIAMMLIGLLTKELRG
jgi:hypothetical protein